MCRAFNSSGKYLTSNRLDSTCYCQNTAICKHARTQHSISDTRPLAVQPMIPVPRYVTHPIINNLTVNISEDIDNLTHLKKCLLKHVEAIKILGVSTTSCG